MLRKIFNKIFSSRIFYILFSLLVAVALWMFVELSENQTQRYTISNVQVIFRNEDVLRDRKFLRTSVEPQTVTLSYTTTRAIAQNLTSNTVFAEVDLAGVTRTGSVPLSYEVILPAGLDRNALEGETRSVARITVIIDRLSTVTIPVRVDYRGGTASDDLIAELPEFSPQEIEVTGPEDVLSRISYARVPIYRENLASTYFADLDFILLDENDEALDESLLGSLTADQNTINVTVNIKQIKSIPLLVEFSYSAGATEQNTIYSIEPQFITVSGDPEVIKEYNSITLRTINTALFRAIDNYTFPIILQNGVTNLSGETEAFVKVEVLGLDIDYYSTNNLYAINAPTPTDYRVEWITQSLDVRIRGRREDLDLVSLENIRVVADLREFTSAGTYFIPATAIRVFIDGVAADIGAIGEYRVTIRIIREMEPE